MNAPRWDLVGGLGRDGASTGMMLASGLVSMGSSGTSLFSCSGAAHVVVCHRMIELGGSVSVCMQDYSMQS